jgi:signal transduction histidine kinase
MPPSSVRSAVIPDSARSSVAVAELDALVDPADRPLVDAHVGIIGGAPGAAILLWGAEALFLAYNRHYRTATGLRASSLGKPFFKAQPELERTWRQKLDLVQTGSGVTVDGAAFTAGPEAMGGEQQLGWLMPVTGRDGRVRGVFGMFMDVGAMLEPMRRLVGAVAQDMREPLVGIEVVSDRLSRLPKPTRERCVEDMDQVRGYARHMDRLVDDMAAFARRAGAGGGARLSLRPGDLGAIVKSACDKLGTGHAPTLRFEAAEVQGLWDEDAIRRAVMSLVASASQHGAEGGEVVVEVTGSRESAVISIRDDGPALRGEAADQMFEPWKRGGAPVAERRRRGAGLGLFLARELVQAHGGKITGEGAPQGGFVVRVTLPIVGAGGAPVLPARESRRGA